MVCLQVIGFSLSQVSIFIAVLCITSVLAQVYCYMRDSLHLSLSLSDVSSISVNEPIRAQGHHHDWPHAAGRSAADIWSVEQQVVDVDSWCVCLSLQHHLPCHQCSGQQEHGT